MNKYHNKITEYKGRNYHSKKEANYAAELDLRKHAKNIKERVLQWTPQVKIALHCASTNELIGHYVADFKVIYADNKIEWVDVKGVRTALYKWKKKHAEKQYGIKVLEI